ncbi:hypothetical protein [Streptosporangium sp. KLBMP 9127]|nr:hypothetical protein [Streptosporangium sp. KLBMP 9127]
MRAALVEKYNTVRPFLRLLGQSKALAAAPGGRRVVAAVRRLPELPRRRVSKRPLLGRTPPPCSPTPGTARSPR